MAFEDARRERRARYTRMEQDFIELLSVPEVRLLGDSLEKMELYIADHYRENAAAALAELYYRVPRASLGGSARRVLTELDRLKDYPEAEYWIGETYLAEGELGVALGQFEKAYGLRGLLEVPGFALEILYEIVDIHRRRQEYNEMEKRALEIIDSDTLWSGDAGVQLRGAMFRTLKNDGLTRFLTLYRYNNPAVERAHRLLGLFYYASGRHYPAEEHLMFAFLIQNTVIIEEVIRDRYDYSFNGLGGLLNEALRKPLLRSYLEEAEYYKTAYYFAGSLYGADNALPAAQLWRFLEGQDEAGEWRGRARNQLVNPVISASTGRVLEIPSGSTD
jgi:tetratricopeptide (TPR) repeat protein